MDTTGIYQTVLFALGLSLVLGVIVIGSLVYNARLWLQDYPKPIRDKLPPLSPAERRERIILAILLLGTLFGGVLIETLRIKAAPEGTLSFGAAYLRIVLMFGIFNLFDALVLDLGIIAWLQPKFVLPPGAEGMGYLLRDYRRHLTDFMKGIAFSVIASLPFAAITVL